MEVQLDAVGSADAMPHMWSQVEGFVVTDPRSELMPLGTTAGITRSRQNVTHENALLLIR
jgi:hypothetical protein